jgi:hypothetical protein
MKEFSEKDLDLTEEKIKNIENQLSILINNFDQLAESLKDTQRYLVKLAHNQMDMTKRVSQWPFLVVHDNNEE